MPANKYDNGTSFAALLLGYRRGLARAGSGAATGTGEGDTSEPPTISNLHLTSFPVLDTTQGLYLAIITATWDFIVPNTAEDGDPDVAPVKDYWVSYSHGSGWSRESATPLNTVTLPGQPIEVDVTVRVRPRTTTGSFGPYTTAVIYTAKDTTPPPQPSDPTIVGTVRGISVKWDGLFAGGAPRPADFAYVIAEVSLDPTFGSGEVHKGGTLSEKGQTAVTQLVADPQGTEPFAMYARLVAVDKSGLRSSLSNIVAGQSIAVGSGDIVAGAITADELFITAVTGKIITSGTYRTGVENEDRIEIIDEEVYDAYLGYNRSIRDTIRWIRGYDNALVGEIRGYMGDIGAYGLHLNSDLELGNLYSTIYQVGKRKGSGGSSHNRVRAGSFNHTTTGGQIAHDYGSALDADPGAPLITPTSDFQWTVIGHNADGFALSVRHPDGTVPGDGFIASGYYYVEDFV